MKWKVKNWFVQDFKGHGHDTDEWRDYDEDNVPFERLEKVYVSDEDSLEQRMNIFHGQLYSLYSLHRDNRKFRLPLQLFWKTIYIKVPMKWNFCLLFYSKLLKSMILWFAIFEFGLRTRAYGFFLELQSWPIWVKMFDIPHAVKICTLVHLTS